MLAHRSHVVRPAKQPPHALASRQFADTHRSHVNLPAKRLLTLLTLMVCVISGVTRAQAPPAGPKALDFPHFPDRLHTFVWRNWTVVPADRLAKVLGTNADKVREIAVSMGLPESPVLPAVPESRIYITILRRNWHLLPNEQLLTLLDISAEEMAVRLREDDFLFVKLGTKPACEPLKYAPPSDAAKARAAEIRQVLRDAFGNELPRPASRDSASSTS